MFLSRICAVVGLLLSLAVVPAYAGVQRMAITPGSYRLPPRTSTSVESFCLDYSRHSPAPGNTFSHVLSDPAAATVTVGGRKMTLQQALDKKIVAIKGTQFTFGQYLHLLNNGAAMARSGISAAERDELQKLVAEWKKLPPALQAEFEREWAHQHPDIGDYRSLNFVSLVDVPISIDVGRATALGVEKEGLPDVSLDRIRAGKAQASTQEKVWHQGNIAHLKQLRDAGFWKSKVSGTFSEKARAAVGKFQDEYGLPVTGEIDERTAPALDAVADNAVRLKSVNAQAKSRFAIATVRTRNAKGKKTGTYSAAVGARTFNAQKPLELYNDLSSYARMRGAGRLYVAPFELTPNEVTSLATSFAIFAKANPGKPRILVLEQAAHGRLDHNEFVGTSVKRSLENPNSVTRAAGSADYPHEAQITLETRSGAKHKLTVRAAARDLLDRFLKNLAVILSKLGIAGTELHASSIGELTAADIVDMAIRQTARDLHLRPSEVHERIRVEFGHTQVTELLWPALIKAA